MNMMHCLKNCSFVHEMHGVSFVEIPPAGVEVGHEWLENDIQHPSEQFVLPMPLPSLLDHSPRWLAVSGYISCLHIWECVMLWIVADGSSRDIA